MNAENANIVAHFLMDALATEFQTTKKVLAALPDGKHSWRPHEKGRTAGELAWHIAAADVWFLDSILKGSFAMEGEGQPPKTSAEIVSFYEKNFPALLEKAKALPAEKFAEVLDFYGMKFPAAVYVNFCMIHSIHHRGQLSAYLRAMGEKVPSIYGGSADEPFVPEKAAGA